MSTLYIMDSHDQLLTVWREMNARRLGVTHLDFHCDMRGLLVDAAAARAFRITDRSPGLDEGNFITHAIVEGRVGRVRWVHDVPGGRRDDVNGVRLASDLSARWISRRLARGGQPGVPFTYEAMTFDQWSGIDPTDFLDIDWDVFASCEYEIDSIEQRIARFLDRRLNGVPEHSALCYSPGYAHDTRQAFEAFGERLAARFNARIVRIPPPPVHVPTSRLKMGMPRPIYRRLRHAALQGVRWLRYRGIY